jgi:hypothetical protein
VKIPLVQLYIMPIIKNNKNFFLFGAATNGSVIFGFVKILISFTHILTIWYEYLHNRDNFCMHFNSIWHVF